MRKRLLWAATVTACVLATMVALAWAAAPGAAVWARAGVVAVLSAVGAAAPPSSVQTALVAPAVPADGLLLDGDLVFRRGRDALASAVLALDPASKFSHVGMIVLDGHGRPQVVHAMPEEGVGKGGVISQPLSDFAAAELAEELAILRMVDLSQEERLGLRDYLLGQLGKPFDLRFQLSNDGALYCTELVIKALQGVGRQVVAELPGLSFATLPEPAFAPGALHQLAGLKVVDSGP